MREHAFEDGRGECQETRVNVELPLALIGPTRTVTVCIMREKAGGRSGCASVSRSTLDQVSSCDQIVSDQEFVTTPNAIDIYGRRRRPKKNLGRVTPPVQIVRPERHTGAHIVTARNDYLFCRGSVASLHIFLVRISIKKPSPSIRTDNKTPAGPLSNKEESKKGARPLSSV